MIHNVTTKKYPRTSAYLGTIYCNDPDFEKDLNRLRVIRNEKNAQRESPAEGCWHLWLRGRLGKNNPNAPRVKGRGTYAGPQDVPLKYAERVDVYLHFKKRYEKVDWAAWNREMEERNAEWRRLEAEKELARERAFSNVLDACHKLGPMEVIRIVATNFNR